MNWPEACWISVAWISLAAAIYFMSQCVMVTG